jgi:hypothetical protein
MITLVNNQNNELHIENIMKNRGEMAQSILLTINAIHYTLKSIKNEILIKPKYNVKREV